MNLAFKIQRQDPMLAVLRKYKHELYDLTDEYLDLQVQVALNRVADTVYSRDIFPYGSYFDAKNGLQHAYKIIVDTDSTFPGSIELTILNFAGSPDVYFIHDDFNGGLYHPYADMLLSEVDRILELKQIGHDIWLRSRSDSLPDIDADFDRSTQEWFDINFNE